MSARNRQTVAPIVLPELVPGPAGADPKPVEILGDVPADVTVIAGRTQMTLAAVRDLREGDILPLDRSPDATVDIYVNGTHIARGDVIVLDDSIATRVSELDSLDRREA